MIRKNSKNLIRNIKNFLESESGSAAATKVILAIIALAGIITVAAMAPNVIQIFGNKYKHSKKYSNKRLVNAFYVLKRRGFVEVTQEKNNKIQIRLTNKGQERVKNFSLDALTIPKQKLWDKKWRMVIFDIPAKSHKNKFNKARDALRNKLKELGFYQLQKSVWVFPYPCEDEVLFIAYIFEIKRFIEILTVEKLLHENRLKYFFKL